MLRKALQHRGDISAAVLKHKYSLPPNVFVGPCPTMKVEAPDDIEKKLRQVGYSDDAVKEILEWYKKNNDRKT